MFDQLGDTSSTGTLQASSAQRIPRRAAALLEKMGCCSRGPWSAFPWSWRPPRSSTGKTKVVGLVELSMPAPLHYAHYDGITMHYLALCDPPTGGPTYCRPLSGCRLPEPLTFEYPPCAPTFLAQVLVRLAGSRPPGRVSLGMESAGRAQPVRSGLALGSGAIRLGWQAGSGSSGTVSAEWEGRNMHTCTHVFRRQLST